MIGFGIKNPQENGSTSANGFFGSGLIGLMSYLISAGIFAPITRSQATQEPTTQTNDRQAVADYVPSKQARATRAFAADTQSAGGSGQTMLTGITGVDPDDLSLNKKSLLGA